MKSKKFIKYLIVLLVMFYMVVTVSEAKSTSTSIDVDVFFKGYVSNGGDAYVCGFNENGRLGIGSNFSEEIKTPVIVMSDVKQIDGCDFNNTFCLKKDGSLYVSGSNEFGLIGNSGTETKNTFVKFMEDVIFVDAGKYMALAIKRDGNLYGWGEYIQYIMNDNKWNYKVPQIIFKDVKAVSCADSSMAIITNSGSLYSTKFENNTTGTIDFNGALGGLHRAPGFQHIADNVKYVSCSENSLFYIDENGALWAMGYNEYGKFLDSQEKWPCYSPVLAPVKIINSGVEKIVDDGTDLLYLTFDGQLYACGMNGSGGYGLGWDWEDALAMPWSERPYEKLYKIADDVVDFACGNDGVTYVTTDGRIYQAGFNAKDGEKSKYFVEGPSFSLANNYNETLINRTGPYDISIKIGEGKILCTDKVVLLEVPAQIINERTMVPLRAIFEALGVNVQYFEETKKIVACNNTTEVVMTIGSDIMEKNGERIKMDIAPVIINDRTLIPVRAVSESFDCSVKWDQETQTVAIKNQSK